MSVIEYPKVTLRDVIKLMWQAISENKWLILLTITGIVIANIFENILTPLYYRNFFNLLTSGAEKTTLYLPLIQILLTILLINGISWLGYRMATFCNVVYQADGMARLRVQAYNYLLKHSYTFFANNFTGSLTQRINRYARAFESLADRVVWNILPLSVRIIGITIVVWNIKPMISVVIVLWTSLFLCFNYFFAIYRLKYDLKRTEADTRATAVLSDSITNHNTIQIFSGYKRETAHYKEAADHQANTTKKVWFMDVSAEAVQALLIITMEFLLFYFAVRYWTTGLITVGTFVLLQAYIIGLGSRLWDFSRVIRDFYQSFADAKEMVEILSLPHEIKDTPTATELVVKTGKVEFKDIEFSFNSTRTVLNKINLDIQAGEKIALIGPSGAGKSTFVRLLLRLYEVSRGHILVDGQDIQHVTQDSLHQNISLVPQDPILFHRTLMENIRYGKPTATDEEVVTAAKLAHCDEFIDDLPKKYETFVGERGIKLSGGERQRVAIARAILKNAPILILDEATSSLDSHSESLIQDALEKLMKGKTTIVIAHRLSTIQKMDRIVVVKDGQIVEEGSHTELLKLPEGLYAKLWNLQAGGFIKDEGDVEKED